MFGCICKGVSNVYKDVGSIWKGAGGIAGGEGSFSKGVRQRRSWSADVLQSLTPTLKKTHLPIALVILKTFAVSQYQVRKVWTCVLSSSVIRQMEQQRTWSYLHYITIRRNTIPNTTASFCFYVNILIVTKKIVQGTNMHYSETKYYIKCCCLFSVSFKV